MPGVGGGLLSFFRDVRASFVLAYTTTWMGGFRPAFWKLSSYLLHVNHKPGRVFQGGRFGFWRDYSVQSMYVGRRVCLDGRNLL